MGKEQTQTVKQQLDPTTQQLQRLAIGSTLGGLGLPGIAAQQRRLPFGGMMTMPGTGIAAFGPQLQPVPGVSDLTRQATGGYQQALDAGRVGLNALTGDQSAIGQLMNPFQSGVLDAVRGQWGDLAANTTNALNDQATRANAFGGTRQGVAQGVALGQLNKDMGSQLAGLQYQGFSDAMDRAGGLASLGMGAAGQLNSLGEYERQVAMQQDPAMRQMSILQGLLSGNPIAMSTSQTQQGNPLNGLLGLGLTAASLAGGLGWAPFAAKAASGG